MFLVLTPNTYACTMLLRQQKGVGCSHLFLFLITIASRVCADSGCWTRLQIERGSESTGPPSWLNPRPAADDKVHASDPALLDCNANVKSYKESILMKEITRLISETDR